MQDKNSAVLPTRTELWPRQELSRTADDQDDFPRSDVTAYTRSRKWQSTNRTIYFFCDIHADADAFLLSLIASGGITWGSDKLVLTKEGKQALFIIGGDCFDKGPSTLGLLDLINQLRLEGAEVIILAGNHDVRTYIGILYSEHKDPQLDHLFVRMGGKSVPLFREIYERFVEPSGKEPSCNEAEIRQTLLPDDDWYDNFPDSTVSWMNPIQLEKEISRIRQKSVELELRITEMNLDFCKVYAAIQKFKEMFFKPDGRYYWFFETMLLGHRAGSYLFVHAGMDDVIARLISDEGIEGVNSEFKRYLAENPFALYHAPLGNAFRTKYRDSDYFYSKQASGLLQDAGIYAIVHGHRNSFRGQRIVMREGMLNFECNATIDQNTRVEQGLSGPGGAVVVFDPNGSVKGISTDYPFIKEFHPD